MQSYMRCHKRKTSVRPDRRGLTSIRNRADRVSQVLYYSEYPWKNASSTLKRFPPFPIKKIKIGHLSFPPDYTNPLQGVRSCIALKFKEKLRRINSVLRASNA